MPSVKNKKNLNQRWLEQNRQDTFRAQVLKKTRNNQGQQTKISIPNVIRIAKFQNIEY